MFLVLRIHLTALGQCGYPGGGGQLTHAAVLRLIETVDPLVSRDVHDRVYPLATSGLRTDAVPPLAHVVVHEGDRAWVRVGVVGEPACATLLGALAGSGLRLPIGRIDCAIERVEYETLLCPNPVSVDGLLEDARSRSGVMRMAFESPTSFSRRGLSLALPAPESVFGRGASSEGGLHARWQEAIGTGLGDFSGGRVGARVVKHHCSRAKVYAEQRPMDAFRGIAEYTASSTADRQAMWTLGLFAQFVGVGVARSMGMGQVRIEEGGPE